MAPSTNQSVPCEHYASLRDLPADALARLEHCAFEYGAAYDSYLATEAGREYFFSSGRRGVIGFRRWGGNMQVVGGLLAEPEHREQLLLEAIEFARRQRQRLMFFGVTKEDCKLYREHQFQVTKLGEEPIVVLDETDWKGAAFEWLRRQEKGCQKAGVTFREVDATAECQDYADRIAPELEQISRQHLAGTIHRREMKFFVGQFQPFALGRRRLFIAESKQRIECFVVLNPCLAGGMWAIEIFRKRADAVRGVIPFAMVQAIRQLQTENVRYVSLSLIPWMRCTKSQGDSFLLRGTHRYLWHYASALYDSPGMYHFKSRFRPHWREMYIASLPGVGLSSIAAIAMNWGLFHVNPFRVVAHWWRDRRDPNRKSLADPGWRADRLIRKLHVGKQGLMAAPHDRQETGNAARESVDDAAYE